MNIGLPNSTPVLRPAAAHVGPDRARDEAKLKKSAEGMEALFVQQLFQAMRQSVPTEGILDRGPGEDLFTSLLDQRVAEQTAVRSQGQNDLSTSLFESLRNRLGPSADTDR